MSSYLVIKKTSLNQKNVTPNQYSDTFWVQNEFIVHNLHLRMGCSDISVVITVKNHEEYVKTTFFDKNQKLTKIIDIF